MDQTTIKESPRYAPRWKAWAFLGAGTSMALFCGITSYVQNDSLLGLWVGLGVLLMFAGAAAHTWFEPLPTTAEVAQRLETETRQREEQAKTDARDAEFVKRWYVRYPLAGVIVWFALYLLERGNAWWVAALAGVVAACLAWELALLGLGVGGIFWLFGSIEKLPIPAAIIIGACIIAYAINSKRQSK